MAGNRGVGHELGGSDRKLVEEESRWGGGLGGQRIC